MITKHWPNTRGFSVKLVYKQSPLSTCNQLYQVARQGIQRRTKEHISKADMADVFIIKRFGLTKQPLFIIIYQTRNAVEPPLTDTSRRRTPLVGGHLL